MIKKRKNDEQRLNEELKSGLDHRVKRLSSEQKRLLDRRGTLHETILKGRRTSDILLKGMGVLR